MIYEKLAKIQREIKAPKNLRNNFGGYMYRNAEGILEAFKPYSEKYNVALKLYDDVVQIGDRYYVKSTATIIDIENGDETSATAYARESAEKKGMDDSQITGTASSYARKYALNGLLLLDDTKDADTDEYQMQQQDKPASQSQKKTIESICKKHAVDYEAWCVKCGTTWDKLTAAQAGQMLQTLKTKYKDE